MKLQNRKRQALKKRISNFMHSPAARQLLVCVLGIAVLVTIYVAAIVPVRYDLKVGMVPNVTVAATKDVEDAVATERNRKQAANAVTPTYRYQEGVTEQVLAKFDSIYAQLRMVNQYAQTLPNPSHSRVYQSEELDYAHSMLTLLNLSDYQLTAVMRATPEELEEAYTLLQTTIQSTMVNHVTQGQESTARNNIKQIVNYRMTVALGQYMAPPVLMACIEPNMVIDQEATEAARQEARNSVEPVIYKQGQNIVVKGEGRVTQSQLNMLSTLGLLSNSDADGDMYLGAGVLVVCVIGVMLALLYTEKELWASWKKLLILLVTMAVTLGLSVAARFVNAFMAPTLLAAFVVTALLGRKAGVACNAAMAVLASSLAAGGNQAYGEVMPFLLVAGLLSGTVAALMLQKKAGRLQLIVTGLVCAAVNFVVIMALGLMTADELAGSVANGLWGVGAALIATLLAVAIMPVLESIFNLATPMKLLELSNPNQPLLRKLMLEAPGTYHHSIIVANLAEAAAEAIGGNPLLARVGGYYHDIGKLRRPSYFKENQMGEKNAHDSTDPYVSAAIVTAHTMDGVTMGKASRLPPEVLEIIGSHHGDTPVMYFYHKAVQLAAAGEKVDMDTFRYNGHPPRSREAAVVLLCDTIEAAVRTLQNPTPEAVEEFIIKLVRGKLEDGQLSDCPLTLRDIDKICAAVTTVLSGVFHERIEYPDVSHGKQQRILHNAQEEQKTAAQSDAPVAEDVQQEASAPAVEKELDVRPVPEAASLPVVEAVVTVEPDEFTSESIILPEPTADPAPILADPTAEPAPVLDMNDLMAEPVEEAEEQVQPAPAESQEAADGAADAAEETEGKT